jgi:hypothetical protein
MQTFPVRVYTFLGIAHLVLPYLPFTEQYLLDTVVLMYYQTERLHTVLKSHNQFIDKSLGGRSKQDYMVVDLTASEVFYIIDGDNSGP